MLDDKGESARVAADRLGPAKVSMTQDKYTSRGRVQNVVAEVMERAISDE